MSEIKEKFTAGPWKFVRVQPEIDTFAIRTMDDDTLAAVGVSPVGWRDGKDIANAALIAAAPEMYARLEQCADDYDAMGMFEGRDRITELLAKARR